MGLNSGAQVLYSLKGLYVGDVVDICKGIASDWKMKTPTIGIDLWPKQAEEGSWMKMVDFYKRVIE